ncbi:MAG: DUF4984 domain-containing protein [Alistipes sp.]|nr:DUF4984 domain-containing protein [Alistipes sp.]
MRKRQYIISLVALLAAILTLGCQSENNTYEGPNYILFSAESYTFGVIDNEEWLEVPISATRTANHDRYIGVEVVASKSSAIEDLHYTLESTTLCIPEGKLTTSLRIRGIADNISVGSNPTITLRLVLNEEDVWEEYGTECCVELQRCCKFDINNFEGYAVLTSTWCMQYMNTESRLVHTHSESENDVVVIEDMFYEDYDIRIKLEKEDRLNPLAGLDGEQVVGSTGEAFGTIYGDGKLLITEAMGTTSYYSMCEGFVLLYTTMYVDGVGTVGTYVNILEWISDDEAERIMREGF